MRLKKGFKTLTHIIFVFPYFVKCLVKIPFLTFFFLIDHTGSKVTNFLKIICKVVISLYSFISIILLRIFKWVLIVITDEG